MFFQVLCKRSCTVTWEASSGGAVPAKAVTCGTTRDTGTPEPLYIGRVFHDGTQTVGKIHPSHGVCYVPYDGKELNFSKYEVLVLQ